MDKKEVTGNGIGIGFGEVLFITFLILKLTHVIDWKWIWIFAPIWIPLGLILLISIIRPR